jgi:hypothetical protein
MNEASLGQPGVGGDGGDERGEEEDGKVLS